MLVSAAHAQPGQADRDAYEAPVDAATEEAKLHFQRGTQWVKEQRWAEALDAFEKAAALRPHAVTTYNVGYCLRALGLYARARVVLGRALAENQAAALPEELVERVRGYLREIESLLARYDVTLEPPDAAVMVDGRPLAREPGAAPVFVAGIAPPGAGAPVGERRFELVVEPGAHVVHVQRKGFSPAVVKLDVQAGARKPLSLAVDKLPARLRVRSTPAGAAVRVNGRDAGLTPLVIERPGGRYDLVFSLEGHDDHAARVALEPGQVAEVDAPLAPTETPIVARWWFWAAAGAVVAGAVVTTYFLTRPEPEPAPYSGGGLGWVVAIP
jgi:hypothetical protein